MGKSISRIPAWPKRAGLCLLCLVYAHSPFLRAASFSRVPNTKVVHEHDPEINYPPSAATPSGDFAATDQPALPSNTSISRVICLASNRLLYQTQG